VAKPIRPPGTARGRGGGGSGGSGWWLWYRGRPDPGHLHVRRLHRRPRQQQQPVDGGEGQLPAVRAGLPRRRRHRQVLQWLGPWGPLRYVVRVG